MSISITLKGASFSRDDVCDTSAVGKVSPLCVCLPRPYCGKDTLCCLVTLSSINLGMLFVGRKTFIKLPHTFNTASRSGLGLGVLVSHLVTLIWQDRCKEFVLVVPF
jgi:hypothetical protein